MVHADLDRLYVDIAAAQEACGADEVVFAAIASVEVLNLCRPVLSKTNFHAAADGISNVRFAIARLGFPSEKSFDKSDHACGLRDQQSHCCESCDPLPHSKWDMEAALVAR